MLQAGNNIRVRQIFWHNILVFEPNMEVFEEVLQLLVEVPTLWENAVLYN